MSKPVALDPKVEVRKPTPVLEPTTITPPGEARGSAAPAKPTINIYKPSVSQFFLKMLIYGPPGAGKTTLAASAGGVKEMQNVLFVNVEGGTLALLDSDVYGSNSVPDTYDFNNFESLDELFKFLLAGDHGYKTVIIDSLSELVKYNLDYIIAKKRANKTAGNVNKDEDDVFLEDYGTMTKQMRRVVRKFRDLPMHVIFTCHDAPVGQEANAQIGAAISNSLRKSVEGFVDVVAYLWVKEEVNEETKASTMVRKMLTSPHGRFIAKDRSPGQRLGKIMNDPTMPKIMDAILQRTSK